MLHHGVLYAGNGEVEFLFSTCKHGVLCIIIFGDWHLVMILVLLFVFLDRVPETMPLYDILNEFQKGHSHMAVVVGQSNKVVDKPPSTDAAGGNFLLVF